MFEVGFTEIVLILGLALLVLGPEKLPGLAEKIGRWTGRARAMARQLRTQLEQEVTLDELAKSRPMQPPAPDAAAPTSTAADYSAAGHGTDPQEAQPYSEQYSGPAPDADSPAAGVAPPPVSPGSPATETATTKDGQ